MTLEIPAKIIEYFPDHKASVVKNMFYMCL